MTPAGQPTWMKCLPPLILITCAFFAYHNSFDAPFIFDDEMNIQSNERVRQLWPVWRAMWGPLATGVSGRPVVQLSFALNFALGGLAVRGYHVTNLVLHAATAILLFGIVRQTLISRRLADRFGRHAVGLALVVALIWQNHPLLSDSVTYISGRTEILAALFLLLTLVFALRGMSAAPGRATFWFVASVAACALGTGCKEILVAAPLLVLLYDRMFVAGTFRQALRQHMGLYIGLFVSLLLIPLNLYMADFHRSALATTETLSSWDYLKTQSQVLTLYLRLAAWPQPLVLDYTGWPLDPPFVHIWPFAMLILLLLAITAYGLKQKWPAAYVGAWFFLILAPTSSLLPLPTEVATERRMYLPLMGLVALVVLGIYRLLNRVCDRLQMTQRGATYFGVAAIVVVAGAETARTILRNDDYKDTLAMWADVVAHRPDNYRAINNLGNEFFRHGDVNSAKECFRKAISLNPMYGVTLNNLAAIEVKQGNEQAAMQYVDRALAIQPTYAPAMRTRSLIFLKRGELSEAEHAVRQALLLRPGSVDTLSLLADILIARRQFAEAERVCREIQRIEPGNVAAWDQLGRVDVGLGRTSDSLKAFRTAHQLSPDEPLYTIHLAWQLAAIDDPSLRNAAEAATLARLAAQTTGPDAVVLDTLALAYAASGQFELAAETATNALQLARSNRPKRVPKIEGRLAAYVAGTMPGAGLRSFEDESSE